MSFASKLKPKPPVIGGSSRRANISENGRKMYKEMKTQLIGNEIERYKMKNERLERSFVDKSMNIN